MSDLQVFKSSSVSAELYPDNEEYSISAGEILISTFVQKFDELLEKNKIPCKEFDDVFTTLAINKDDMIEWGMKILGGGVSKTMQVT